MHKVTGDMVRVALTGAAESENMTVYEVLAKLPVSMICDLLARHLNEQGIRVTQPLEIAKVGENFYGKQRR